MNTIEQNHIEREEITGLQFGPVIGVADSANMRRVKIRVRGVFDEPVKKADIPWALPLLDYDLPNLGDEVCVIFEKNDIECPRYFPKTVLDKSQKEEKDRLYSAIIDTKKGSAISATEVVSGSVTEPVDDSDGKLSRHKSVRMFPEDVATETSEGFDRGNPETGMVVEVCKEKGKESVSVFHPKGTFIDIRKNGDVIIHGVNDIYTVADGNDNGVVAGNKLLRVKGALELKVDGNISIKTEGTFNIEAPKVKVTGGELEVNGTAAPTGSGPFCAIPSCLFTGAPHVGNKVSGT